MVLQEESAQFILHLNLRQVKNIKHKMEAKMKRQGGKMNVPFSEVYDEEDDVYYVTFKTGEPSYCREVDDILIIELGLFTNLPTGFRILNFNRNKIKQVKFSVLFEKVKKALQDINPPRSQDRQIQFREVLQEILS
jgi:hypothetical protein